MLIRSQKFQRMAEKLARVERMTEREGGEREELRKPLEEALRGVGVELATARLMDRETLARALEGDPARLWGVAEALYLDGVLAGAEGDEPRAEARLRKALALYGRLEPGLELPDEAAAPAERIEEIEARLEGV